MKYSKIKLLYLIGVIILSTSCSLESMEELFKPLVKAPGATIERKVKGHDQIYSVQVILRLTLPVKGSYSYVAYGLSNIKTPPIPIYQQIDISKDDQGQITITSERKHFDVIKSENFYCYSLELKYYDLNGKLINHQFSYFDEKDKEGSTLLHHQHFFTVHNYSLNGQLMLYPTTLDGKYYDEFTFLTDKDGKRIKGTQVSPNNVYVSLETKDDEPVDYNQQLAQIAAERATTKQATDIYELSGKKYRLYKTLNTSQLNDKAKDIFSYEYRDTDPVDSYLYSPLKGLDDLGRIRTGKVTQFLQQRRELGSKARPDYLGFKGILRLKKSDIIFQMRICIAHMITDTEKYKGTNSVIGNPREHDQISPAWNSYDIDYPLEFRVIADLDGDKEQFVKDVQRVYPNVSKEDLLDMFSKNPDWFAHIPRVIM